jgi:hypothetical protein
MQHDSDSAMMAAALSDRPLTLRTISHSLVVQVFDFISVLISKARKEALYVRGFRRPPAALIQITFFGNGSGDAFTGT